MGVKKTCFDLFAACVEAKTEVPQCTGTAWLRTCLAEVHSFALHNGWRRNYYHSIQSAKFFTPHRNAQELMEAKRCLPRIIEPSQEVAKTCAHALDGTSADALHSSNAGGGCWHFENRKCRSQPMPV